MILALNELMILKRKVNAHLDRTDLHTDKLCTVLSILQQLEAKQDLMFNNAPPVPGQEEPPHRVLAKTIVTSNEDAPDGHTWHYPKVYVPEPVFPDGWGKVSITMPTEKRASVVKAVKKAKGDFEARKPYHASQIDNGVIPLEAPRKRGRPRKTPKA